MDQEADEDLTGFVPAKVIAKACGLTPQAFRNAAHDGRIPPEHWKRVDGRWYFHKDAGLDLERSRKNKGAGGLGAAKAAITSMRARAYSQGAEGEVAAAVDAAAAESEEILTAEKQMLKAELEKKVADAEAQRLKVAREAGRLMDRHSGTLEMARLGKSMRQAMLQLPDRVADRVAVMEDAFEIRRLLKGEIESLLLRFIEDLERREVAVGGG